MYVVRIQNDEAVMYRAFRRLQSAKIWAAEKDVGDLDCLVDILDAPDTDDTRTAIDHAKAGESQRILQAEVLSVPQPFVAAGSDIQFGAARLS